MRVKGSQYLFGFLWKLIQSKRGRIYTATQKPQTKHIEMITPNIPDLKKKNLSKKHKNLFRSQKIEHGALNTHILFKTFNKQPSLNFPPSLYSKAHVLQFATTVMSYFRLSLLQLSYMHSILVLKHVIHLLCHKPFPSY